MMTKSIVNTRVDIISINYLTVVLSNNSEIARMRGCVDWIKRIVLANSAEYPYVDVITVT